MGIGGASVLPVTLSIITVIFPPQERGKAIGFWAAAVGGAVALGPIVGGLLLEHPEWFNWLTGNDWGSVFFINVPIVIVGIIGIVLIVPETKNPHHAQARPDRSRALRSSACSRSSTASRKPAGARSRRTYGSVRAC